MKLNSIKACLAATVIVAVGIYAGCKPEKLSEGNGLTSPDLKASFTVTPVTGKANYYVLKANESGLLGVKWDLGDGGVSTKALDTIFYPDADKYTIKLTAIGKGGAQVTASQDLTVPLSDPKAGNLVKGGKMGVGDDQFWTHFIVGTGSNMIINEAKGVMTANESGFQAGAIYQTVNLTAGQKYMVDMIVSGSGATNSWFEVWVDTKQPVNGQDYNSGIKPTSLNTYSGCGKDAFDGKLTQYACAGDGNPFTVPATGTYYLVIKCGGDNTGLTGISFTKVTLRGVQ